MTKQEWITFEPLLRGLGIKPTVIESKNGQGELLGLQVRFSVDNIKFMVKFLQEDVKTASKKWKK